MSYLLYIFLPVLAVLVFAISVTLRAADSPKSATPAQPAKAPAAQTPLPPAREIATFSETKLREMLAKIETAPAPREYVTAMCYMTSFYVADRVEYTCPTCNKKTLHTVSAAGGISASLPEELTLARRLIKEIQKHAPATKLRENNHCDNCKPKREQRGKPNLGIVIRYDAGREITTDNISLGDLRMLVGFFSGSLTYKDEAGLDTPLQPNMSRLRQLLGEPATPPPTVPPEKK